MQNERTRARIRRVYQVIEKSYFTEGSIEYQAADAFSYLTHTCGSLKTAREMLQIRLEAHAKVNGLVFDRVTNVVLPRIAELWECNRGNDKRKIVYIQTFIVLKKRWEVTPTFLITDQSL